MAAQFENFDGWFQYVMHSTHHKQHQCNPYFLLFPRGQLKEPFNEVS
jgi:hypothetical protein